MRMMPLTLFALALPACGEKDQDSSPVDSGADFDGDGWATPEDCDDEDPGVNPDAQEIYDGVDQDCSGVADDNLPRWGYVDSEAQVGPERWADYWPACAGSEQSPVDIQEPFTETQLSPLELHYSGTPVSVKNNGHSLQWTVSGENYLMVDGLRWDLEQFHLHADSEHTVQGQRFPMEVHLVHRNDNSTVDTSDDLLLVMGALFEVSDDPHPHLDALGWGALPAEEDEVHQDAATFSPALLFGDASFNTPNTLRYDGSLTTPPCLEIVSWVLIDTSQPESGRLGLPISAAQLSVFTDIHQGNYRETQALNGRALYVEGG
ncbi:MAG: carbonic anhydrase family protein [Alphaproteobacteria bacterium]|nr:carbonic anhydrase family protein [Alphaproteobacteria bacterium]MCB9794966.1 carbonic anhydrase family protein [Alphaproteobacteria bacterium]